MSIDDLVTDDPQPVKPVMVFAEVVGDRVFLTGLTESQKQVRYVSSGFFGIMLAGTAYPSVCALLIVLASLAWSPQGLTGAISASICIAVAGAACGLLISIFTGAIAIPLVIAVNRSLGNPMSARSATLCAGSIAGYLPTAWVMFSPPGIAGSREAVLAIFLGPVLAMCLGAYGAAISSAAYSKVNPVDAVTREKGPLLISHLMIATAWIAVTLSIGNYFGGTGFVIGVLVWLGLQTLILLVVNLVAKRRKRKASVATEILPETKPH